MNRTVKLLRTIGSPFVSEQELPENNNEALELHDYATKNKIGLLYLEVLKNHGKLEEFGLKLKYREAQEKHDEQLITAVRISELFNSFCINYAIFKSIMPYPAILNDVDIIHFGSDEGYKKVMELMLQSGYEAVKVFHVGKITDKQDALEYQFHDTRNCVHKNPLKKDIYDLDIYQKIKSLDYLLYLDKGKLQKYVTTMNLLGCQSKVLRPEAELVAIITHAIIKEQIFTLLVYYAMLYHLAGMHSKEIDKFIEIAKENNVTIPIKACCSLVAELHETAHGFCPEKLSELITTLGYENHDIKKLIKNDLKMPHHYSLLTITKTFVEIAKESNVRKSIAKQIISMLNPHGVKRAIVGFISLRRRETY